MVGLYGPIQILLPNQVESLAPEHKEAVLAWMLGAGALFAMIANPLWGALSDRTVTHFGMRLPWVAIGTIAGALGLTVLAAASTVPMMMVAWCAVSTALNAPWAALTAAVPDHVPPHRRGTVAGYLGLAQILGVVIGTGIATAVPGAAGYLICALAMLLSVGPYLWLRHDLVLARESRPPGTPSSFVRGFWVSPAVYPDFGWAWLTRFLINLGNAIVLTYLLYFVRDGLRAQDAEFGVLILTLINIVGVVAVVVLFGSLSDRLDRRKIFVGGSGMIMAAATFLVAGVQTWTVTVVAAMLLGVGFGAYTSVDFALITQVLPATRDHGKDLGMLNVASALPQLIAPAVAGPIVTSQGGYPALFATSGVISVLGSVFVIRIRSVA